MSTSSSPRPAWTPPLSSATPSAQGVCRQTDEDLASMLLIRIFEERLLGLFGEGLISGTTHTCLGQEHVPVALTPLVQPNHVFSNHRGHGHYLAQFDDPEGLLAEITGREGAVCAGRGGSQHLLRDGFCSSGVQGQGVPLALGAALHLKHRGRPGVALAYIGDGTWGQGAVYEALNMASLWSAPLIVAVENNGIAQTTPTAAAMAGTIKARAKAFGVPCVTVVERCVSCIRARVSEPVAAVRAGRGPLVLEFVVDRLGPHSKGDDTRPAEEVAQAKGRDWVWRYQAAHPEQFHDVARQVTRRVDDVVDAVLARPLAAEGQR